jgi:uncharacterized protein (DUF4415 family)
LPSVDSHRFIAFVRTARVRGKDKSDWARVSREKALGILPSDDEDSPNAAVEMRKHVAKLRAARGRPKLDNPKQLLTLRLSREVIAYFKATGPGWQTRIEETLKMAMGAK